MTSSILHGDFETRSAVDIKKAGADIYARHPSTDILCFGFKFDEEAPQLIKYGEQLPPRIRRHIEMGGKFIAHNAAFELAIWNYVCVPVYGWPTLNVEQTECTMARAYAMGVPGSLEKAAAALGIDKQKDMAGNRVMIKLATPKEVLPWGEVVWHEPDECPDLFEKLYAYCLQDVEVEAELDKRLLKLSPMEQKVWILDQKINQRGIQIDLPAVKAAIEIVESERLRLDAKMREVTGNQVATCTATKQLTDWIETQNVTINGVAKSDVTEMLSREGLPEPVWDALLLRQEAAKSSTAKLKAMLDRADGMGRVRGIFQYHGAGTGRWAGRGIQPQNFPRPSLKQSEIEEVFEIFGSET